mmetsp:Transcript_70389/g.155251  ORF Transcript_70389/g.155251 Transcript_70389/m.155251 type:complete len:236 (+) Transcript_70389:27-734(+)
MAPMQQRMLDILAEVQGGFSEPLEELVKKPLETAGSSRPSADGEGLKSSLGRALRLGRENVKAKEYQRLVTRLVGDPSGARKTSRNFRRRTGGPPRTQRPERPEKAQSRPEAMSPRSTTSLEEEVAEIGSPIVVHRHYHHHYHHHYAVSELEEMGHLVGEESGMENAAPATSGDFGDGRSEIEHHHRHHHVMEVEMGLRARQLLEDALEARARGSGPKPGSSDGTKPDPRLPRLC